MSLRSLPPGWTPEHPSPLPASSGFRRPDPPIAHSAPASSPPHFSTSPPPAASAFFQPRSPIPPTHSSSHYYRPPKSALASPATSTLSTPAVSPTRAARKAYVQAQLDADPLLKSLSPVAVQKLAEDPELGFSPSEREWSICAAEGIVRAEGWIKEVKGWSLSWPKGHDGEGYLPPSLDQRKKRRKMGTIEEAEEDEGSDGPDKALRRKLFSNGSLDERGQVTAADSLRAGDEQHGENANGSVRPPTSPRSRKGSLHRQSPLRGENEYMEDEEYYSSLPRSLTEHYQLRIEQIRTEIEDLDVEGLKGKLLSYRIGAEGSLTSSSAVMAATTLQLLPLLYKITKMLSIWNARLAVLKIVPSLLRWLEDAKNALRNGEEAITHPSVLDGTERLDEGVFGLLSDMIESKIVTSGKLMDRMLDQLEGHPDVLPDLWITEQEELEEGYARWKASGEQVVLETRLHYSSREEEAKIQREKMQLVQETRAAAEAAEEDTAAADGVLEDAGRVEQGLMDALDAQNEVKDNILIQTRADQAEWADRQPAGLGINGDLLRKLDEVDESEWESRGRRFRRHDSIESAGSIQSDRQSTPARTPSHLNIDSDPITSVQPSVQSSPIHIKQPTPPATPKLISGKSCPLKPETPESRSKDELDGLSPNASGIITPIPVAIEYTLEPQFNALKNGKSQSSGDDVAGALTKPKVDGAKPKLPGQAGTKDGAPVIESEGSAQLEVLCDREVVTSPPASNAPAPLSDVRNGEIVGSLQPVPGVPPNRVHEPKDSKLITPTPPESAISCNQIEISPERLPKATEANTFDGYEGTTMQLPSFISDTGVDQSVLQSPQLTTDGLASTQARAEDGADPLTIPSLSPTVNNHSPVRQPAESPQLQVASGGAKGDEELSVRGKDHSHLNMSDPLAQEAEESALESSSDFIGTPNPHEPVVEKNVEPRRPLSRRVAEADGAELPSAPPTSTDVSNDSSRAPSVNEDLTSYHMPEYTISKVSEAHHGTEGCHKSHSEIPGPVDEDSVPLQASSSKSPLGGQLDMLQKDSKPNHETNQYQAASEETNDQKPPIPKHIIPSPSNSISESSIPQFDGSTSPESRSVRGFFALGDDQPMIPVGETPKAVDTTSFDEDSDWGHITEPGQQLLLEDTRALGTIGLPSASAEMEAINGLDTSIIQSARVDGVPAPGVGDSALANPSLTECPSDVGEIAHVPDPPLSDSVGSESDYEPGTRPLHEPHHSNGLGCDLPGTTSNSGLEVVAKDLRVGMDDAATTESKPVIGTDLGGMVEKPRIDSPGVAKTESYVDNVQSSPKSVIESFTDGDSFWSYNEPLDLDVLPIASSTPPQHNAGRVSISVVPDLPSISEASTPKSQKSGYFGADLSPSGRFLPSPTSSPALPQASPRKGSSSQSRTGTTLLGDEYADGSVKYKAKDKASAPELHTLFASPPSSPVQVEFSFISSPSADTNKIDEPSLDRLTSDSEGIRHPVLPPTIRTDAWPESPAPALSPVLPALPPENREETPKSGTRSGRGSKITVLKRNARNQQSATTPVKAQRAPVANLGTNSSQALKGTPILKTPSLPPDADLDTRVKEVLKKLPQKVKLTASNLQRLNAESENKSSPLRSWDDSMSSIPTPKSVTSEPRSATSQRFYVKPSFRRHVPNLPNDIKIYHLHTEDEQPPMKLYVRLVGNARLVCRVGGGWSDLEEYLKEWASHHGSKMRAVSSNHLEIQDIPPHRTAGQRTIRATSSNSSLPRYRSPTPNGGFYRSPSPATSRPVSPALSAGRPQRSVSPAFMVTTTSTRHSLPPRSVSPAHWDSTTRPGLRRSESPGLGPSPIPRNHRPPPITPTTSSFPKELTPPSPREWSSPPSRPGSSHSATRSVSRQASRLSFTESAVDVLDSASNYGSPLEPAKPLGLAGPKTRSHITPDRQAWVEDMLGQVRKASASVRPPSSSGSAHGDWDAHDDTPADSGPVGSTMGRSRSATPAEYVVEEGRMPRAQAASGGTRRVYLKKGGGVKRGGKA